MNTKPTIKRHDLSKSLTNLSPPGISTGTIEDAEIAVLLAQVVATFVHLENFMAFPLARLSGCDERTSGYMLRSVKSPRGRVDLMRELLTKDPRNQDLGEQWDEVLAEFWRINQRRNAYVHGQWWSHGDGSTWLVEQDEHGLSVLAARTVKKEELHALRAAIKGCVGLILKLSSEQPQ
jgi:hypothetical protein